jgi:hypothetical protein
MKTEIRPLFFGVYVGRAEHFSAFRALEQGNVFHGKVSQLCKIFRFKYSVHIKPDEAARSVLLIGDKTIAAIAATDIKKFGISPAGGPIFVSFGYEFHIFYVFLLLIKYKISIEKSKKVKYF